MNRNGMRLRTALLVILLILAPLASCVLLLGTTVSWSVDLPGGDRGDTAYHVGGWRVPASLLAAAHGIALALSVAAAWLLLRGNRNWAFAGFAVTAGIANLTCAALCIYCLSIMGIALLMLTSVALVPVALGCGMAWVLELRRHAGGFPGRPIVATCLVIAVSAAPISMMIHPWPLRLAFLVSEPALERVADETMAGRPATLPRWAGLFRIVDSQVAGGSIALITDPHPNGRSGWVRVAPPAEGELSRGPLFNLNWDLAVSRRWRYQNED